jgi:hypothetical protein
MMTPTQPSLTLGSVRLFGSLGIIEGPPDLSTYPVFESVSIRHNPKLFNWQPPRVFSRAVGLGVDQLLGQRGPLSWELWE